MSSLLSKRLFRLLALLPLSLADRNKTSIVPQANSTSASPARAKAVRSACDAVIEKMRRDEKPDVQQISTAKGIPVPLTSLKIISSTFPPQSRRSQPAINERRRPESRTLAPKASSSADLQRREPAPAFPPSSSCDTLRAMVELKVSKSEPQRPSRPPRTRLSELTAPRSRGSSARSDITCFGVRTERKGGNRPSGVPQHQASEPAASC